MRWIYASPLRVYLCLGALAIAGILSGTRLPVSLFPNSAKPEVGVNISYGSSSAEEFLQVYGKDLEDELKSISTDQVQVEKVEATYGGDHVRYSVKFKWQDPFQDALKEVESVVHAYSARFPIDVRDSVHVWWDSENSGFLAISFYSPIRSPDELYDILDPVLTPALAAVHDAQEPELYNPDKKEILIELNPEKMAALRILPRDVDHAVIDGLSGHYGGTLDSSGGKLNIVMPRLATAIEDLSRIPVPGLSGRSVHLGELARIDYTTPVNGSRSFKTNGTPSLILFAAPRAGGNIKRMSERMLSIVRQSMKSLPSDIQYKVLVDPSEFINSAIHNVMREVAIGGLLAVAVLFLFVGSLRNTATAAIEIPLSMVLAFILMRLSGMNLNLISLGGLALSSGMNVDASVVVMENIFRHFDECRASRPEGTVLGFEERLDLIVKAVKEVRFAVVASTVASLVVFLPLAFTSDLSYAILGDLAKTVVFSHGFSAFVALILVPTVRLQLMSKEGGEKPVRSPIEPWIRKAEDLYGRALRRFISSRGLQVGLYSMIAASLALLVGLVLPRLPREIIGKPDTDWIVLSIDAKANTLFRQMEAQAGDVEARLLKDLGGHIQYTFTQVDRADSATVMARLKDKREMREIWRRLEGEFANTPWLRFSIDPWNPAELPIPDPPQLKLLVQGSSVKRRVEATRELSELFEEKQVLPRVWTDPDVTRGDDVMLRADPDQWTALRAQDSALAPSDLADLVRVATTGRPLTMRLAVRNQDTDIVLRYPRDSVRTVEDIQALPVGAAGRLVPLRAVLNVSVEERPPSIYRENGRDVFAIYARRDESGGANRGDRSYMRKARELVARWKARRGTAQLRTESAEDPEPTVRFDDAEKDLNEALAQLGEAVALSVLLIFLTLLIQFGDGMNAILVLVAIPLGFIGVLGSLFVFHSTLSLNSVLGVILLNGIAVANSIILVDFQKRLVERGLSPAEAAIEAGRKRLRPILITSLTTVLAMLPIAAGLGEGGRILQPLGIAVSGGLGVSMGLTLFVVPALQAAYLGRKFRSGGQSR